MNMDGVQIAQLVGLIAVLILFVANLGDTIQYKRWFRKWEADRKARYDAEQATLNPPKQDDDAPKGPWN